MAAQDPFVAEICMVPFNFAPKGWAWCDGQILPISQNTALFALLGTTYGGDGKSNFALPDLQGRCPIHQGQGQGLTERFLGETGGTEYVTLLESEMPVHTHIMSKDTNGGNNAMPTLSMSTGGAGTTGTPKDNYPATSAVNLYRVTSNAESVELKHNLAGVPAGGSQPHNNLQPYLTVYFIIALQGVFPSRS